MVDIKNDEQLRQVMIKICEDVIKIVSDKILDLIKERIKNDVYGGHGQNKIYFDFNENRSEFYNAFDWKSVEKNTRDLTRELFYNWQKLSVTPEVYRHSSYIESWGDDTRSQLAKYLNIDGRKGSNPNLFLSVDRKPYWDNAIKELFDQNKINRWFEFEFRRYGVIK